MRAVLSSLAWFGTSVPLLCVAAVSLCAISGCADLRHELQPHRLRKINSGPPPSWDPEFTSISRPGLLRPRHAPTASPAMSLTANSAEIALVRSQNED